MFGITGDLATKMLLSALYRLSLKGALPERHRFHPRRLDERAAAGARVHDSVAAHGRTDEDAFARFAGALRPAAVDYGDPDRFPSIAQQPEGRRILAHYLAIAPSQYARAAELLARTGLNSEAHLAV